MERLSFRGSSFCRYVLIMTIDIHFPKDSTSDFIINVRALKRLNQLLLDKTELIEWSDLLLNGSSENEN